MGSRLPHPAPRSGRVHDPAHRHPQLPPVPGDARIAGADPRPKPERLARGDRPDPRALGPRQAAASRSARRATSSRRRRATSATRSRPGAQPVVEVIASRPRADAPAVRARRDHRHRRRAGPRSLDRLETRRPGRPRRERRVAHPLLDAVLPARHDPAADLRVDAPLVPVVRDDDARGDIRLAARVPARPGCRTSCCRWRRSRSG